MMPWFKGPIYIVTPSQPPSWLNTSNPRVNVIHQDSILPPGVSPVFSSFPVEFYLHTIPNISDIFIYLNDDYMFGVRSLPMIYLHLKVILNCSSNLVLISLMVQNFMIKNKYLLVLLCIPMGR